VCRGSDAAHLTDPQNQGMWQYLNDFLDERDWRAAYR